MPNMYLQYTDFSRVECLLGAAWKLNDAFSFFLLKIGNPTYSYITRENAVERYKWRYCKKKYAGWGESVI